MQTWTGTPEDYLSQRPNRTHLQWICSVGNALLTFFFNTCQSVNGATPGDYKLQNPFEHTISERCIIKEAA